MAGDVFISYRRARDSVAQRLEERLRDNGFADYQIFRDVRGLFPGENFERQLTDTLQRTKIVLLLLGPGDAPRPDAADWLTQELRAALRARRPVLPILLKGADKDLELWPAELDAVRLTQFLRFGATETSDDVKKLVAVLRRYGVRPLRALAQWSSLLAFNPVDDALDQLSGLTRDDEHRVVLLRGESGTGRTHVMKTLSMELTSADQPVDVGLHHALDHRLVGVDCAAAYDWVADVILQRGSSGSELEEFAAGGLMPAFLPRSLIDRLDADQRLRLSAGPDGVEDGRGKSTVAEAVLAKLSEQGPLVLLLDDLDLADAGSQELVLLLAQALGRPDPPDIHLVLAAAENPFLDLFFRGLEPPTVVTLRPSVETMLKASGVVDDALVAKLSEHSTPSQCVLYLRHLHDRDLIVRTDEDGKWHLRDEGSELPAFADVLDAELDSMLPPGLQQILELGALCGNRFPLSVVERVAESGSPAAETMQRLLDYDQDRSILRRSVCPGEDRMSFSSSMWWRHLRSRRTDAKGAPIDGEEVRRLAAALSEYACTSAEPFDDWSTVGFLFDSIDDYALSGAAFLRAARAARTTRANEAAARGYEEAARRLELHALMDTTGLDRAGELLRSAYCLYRAATILDLHEDAARFERLLRSAEGVLSTVQALFRQIWPTREHAPDFDQMVTDGAVVTSEVSERLRLQWESLRGFIELERGRRALADGQCGPLDAAAHFSRALHSGEAGLSGSVYRELVVSACAGLALAQSAPAQGESSEAASAAWAHGARAIMLSRTGAPPATSLNGGRDRFGEAEAWVAESRQQLSDSTGSSRIDAVSADGVIATLEAAYRLVSTEERRDHPARLIAIGLELLDAAADLEPFRNHHSYERDLKMFAFSHDLFRFTGADRLVRMWRDLRELDAPDDTTDAIESHNPLLLHGKIAARWLELDLGVDRIIGIARFRRLRHALESHTVGATDLDGGAHGRFVRMVHLADMRASVAGDDEVWARAVAPDGLAPAYARAFHLKARRLERSGRLVSEVTSSFHDDPLADGPSWDSARAKGRTPRRRVGGAPTTP